MIFIKIVIGIHFSIRINGFLQNKTMMGLILFPIMTYRHAYLKGQIAHHEQGFE